jgi:hypothetical protein
MPACRTVRRLWPLAVFLAIVLAAPLYAQLSIQTLSGVIAGRLQNAEGTPAVGIPISVNTNDGAIFSFSGPQRTDSAGRFRFTGLAPGRYRVIAGAVEYNPTYYPGTTNANEATFVTLTQDATVENVNFSFTGPSTFRVAGKIRRPAGTRPDAPMVTKVGLHDLNAFISTMHGGMIAFLFEAPVTPDGTFELRGIPRGKYKLSTEPVLTSWTPFPLAVSDGDVTGLDLVVPLESQVRVIVTTDERILLPTASVSFTGPYGGREAQVPHLMPLPPGPFPSRLLTTALPAGEHRVLVSGLPSPYFVKTITNGARDLLREPLLVDGMAPLEVVVTLALPPGSGVKVAGRVILPAGMSLLPSPTAALGVPTGLSFVEAPINADGTFEFQNVPRGNYIVTLSRAAARLYQPPAISVTDKDVAGADIIVPRQIELRGNVIVEGGGPLPKPRLETNRAYHNTGPAVLDDGTFKITLPEGDYRFGVQELPNGYYTKSVTYGAVDLLTQPLRLGGAPAADVLVTLSTRVPAPWRKVSGRLTGFPSTATATVQLSGNRENFHTRSRTDGTFEFPEVLPGQYRVLTGPYNLPQPSIVVSDRDVSGIELPYRSFAIFRGRMVMEDGGPAAWFELRFAGPAFSQLAQNPVEFQENGRFTVSLPEEEISLSMTSPPAGYKVKSITYGDKDLLGGSAKLSAADRQEIVVTFATTSPPLWRKVSGRVVTPADSGVKPAHVRLASSRITYQVPVAPDGSFEFSRIPPGAYWAPQPLPVFTGLNPTVHITDKDIAGVEIQYPTVFEVAGRTVMADGSGVPLDTGWSVENTAATSNFRLLVRGGEHKIAFGNSGTMYRIASATYGAIDLLNQPLRLAAPATGEILVTLAQALPRPATGGVTVKGRVTGAISEMPEPRRVLIYDDATRQYSAAATLSPDGFFEFRNVPVGGYMLVAVGVPHAAQRRTGANVKDQNIADLDMIVFRSVKTTIRLVTEDGNPLPTWVRLNLLSKRSLDDLESELPADGRLDWIVSEDEQFLVLKGLPAEYTVKSMMYGEVDLLKSPLKLDPAAAVAEIRITVGR